MRYIYPVLALFMLASCGKEKKEPVLDHAKTDWAHYKLNGNVQSVSEKSFRIDNAGKLIPGHENFDNHNSDMAFNKKGQLTEIKTWLNDGKPYDATTYAGKDNRVAFIQYMNGSPSVKTDYKWDKGYRNNVSYVRANADNTPLERMELKMEKGKPAEKKVFDQYGHIADRTEYTYDKNGNLAIQRSYLNKEYMQFQDSYEYDGGNRILNEIRTDGTGNRVSKTSYEYDGKNLVKKTNYGATDKVENYEAYTYDHKNNPASKTTFSELDGEATEYNEYDKNNNRLSWKLQRGGKTEIFAEYTYDSHNNMTSYKAISANGDVAEQKTFQFEYDKKGNWIKKTVLITDTPAFVIKREIKYYK